MSLASLNFLFRADTENFERSLRKTKKSVTGFSADIKALGGLLAGAFSVGAVIEFGKSAVQAFDEAEKAAAQLLVATKGNVDEQQRLLDNATLLQSKTLFDDEAIAGAMTMLRALGLNADQIVELTPLVADFATLMNVDLPTAGKLIAKTFSRSTNALQRYGISVEGAAGSSDRFNSITTALTGKVKGLAEATAGAGVSSVDQFKNAWGDVMELIGGKVAPALDALAKRMKSATELRSGMGAKAFATQIQEETRATLKGITVQDKANRILEDRTTALIATLDPLEEAAKGYDKLVKSGLGQFAVLRNETLSQLEGTKVAIKAIQDQIEAGKSLEWVPVNQQGVIKATESLQALQDELADLKKAQSEAPLVSTDPAIKTFGSYKEEIALLEGRIKKLTDVNTVLGETACLEAQIKELNTQYDLTPDIDKKASIQAIIDKLQEAIRLNEQFRGTRLTGTRAEPIAMTPLEKPEMPTVVTGVKPTNDWSIANEKLVTTFQNIDGQIVAVDEKVKGLSTSVTDNTELWGQLTPVIENNTSEVAKSVSEQITMIDALGDSLKSLGSQLMQGGEDWEDFGKMAKNAVRQAAIQIIASYTAIAVAGAIKNTILGPAGKLGPIGVGLAALAGGLTAGVFATAIPKFAQGGLAYAPTMAVVGDNRNAAVDPEIIAPLSKLKNIVSADIRGQLMIRGRDLVYVFGDEALRQSRT